MYIIFIKQYISLSFFLFFLISLYYKRFAFTRFDYEIYMKVSIANILNIVQLYTFTRAFSIWGVMLDRVVKLNLKWDPRVCALANAQRYTTTKSSSRRTTILIRRSIYSWQCGARLRQVPVLSSHADYPYHLF